MKNDKGKLSTQKVQEQLSRIISEQAEDCIFCKDCDFKYTYVNPAMLRLLNCEESDIIGKTPEDVFGRESAAIISEVDIPVLKGQTVDEVKPLTINNIDYLFHTIQVPIYDDDGHVYGICGIVRDVTDRMKADSIIRMQRDLSIELNEAIGLDDVLHCLLIHILKIEFVDVGGIYLRDQDTGALEIVIHQGLSDTFIATASHYDADSPQARLIAKGDPVHLHYSKLQFPIDQSHNEERLKAVMIVPLKCENVVIGALNIASHTLDEFSENTRNAIEAISGMICRAIIRAQTHDALKESEKKIRAIVNTAPMAITTSDMNGVIIGCNQATLDLHGYSNESELIGKDGIDLIAPEYRKLAGENLAQILETGIIKDVEYDVLCKDGRVIPIMFSASVMQTENGECSGFLAIVQDISHAKQMESQLRQSEKMQAIGQLAGGIAHDFNNQLAGVVGYTDLLRKELSNNPELSFFVDNILLAARRASDLTTQLLAFARKGKYISTTVDIHKIIGEVIDILQRTIDKRIVLKQHLDVQILQTKGDPTQLQNAIMNIALNARDAMQTRGDIIFTTSVVQLDAQFCKITPYDIKPGHFVLICITDNGVGIDKSIQKKIFDPFFTTKEHGKGIGMGLASVYGTIKNYGGALEVNSDLGHGTTMKIYLPHILPDSVHEEELVKQVEMINGNASILLVDDEKFVRDIASMMLEKSGYSVSISRNGHDAVEYCKKNWKNIDLVILDMVMPKMNGRETFIELKKINPQIRVLLSSGYSINGEAQQILDEGAMGFIQKPYLWTELAQKVAEILKSNP